MDLQQLFGPGYAGYLYGRDSAKANEMQALQGMGMLSQMQRQAEQSKLLEQELALKKLAEEREAMKLRFGQSLFGGQGAANPAQQALAQGAAQGDVGPTESNAQRLGMLQQQAPQGGSGVLGWSPDQIVGAGFMGLAKPQDIMAVRTGFLPKYDVQNGAIIGGRPGEVPQFAGFVPQAKMADNGQASMLVPTPDGGMRSVIPQGALENYGLFRQADERAKGQNPIAAANVNLDYAKAADAGVNVPQTGAVQFPSSGRAQPGQLTQEDILRQERADALRNGDVNAVAQIDRELSNLRGGRGAAPAPAQPQPGLAISPEQRRKLEADKPQATYSYRSTTANLDRLASVATELQNDVGLSGIAGLQGSVPNIPGSKAANAEAKFNMLKNQVALSTLQAMRDASKTGGAVGNVTDREWPRLESALASLDKKQSFAQMKASLAEIVRIAQDSKNRVAEAYNMTYPQERVQVIPAEGMSVQSGPKVIDFSKLGTANGR